MKINNEFVEIEIDDDIKSKIPIKITISKGQITIGSKYHEDYYGAEEVVLIEFADKELTVLNWNNKEEEDPKIVEFDKALKSQEEINQEDFLKKCEDTSV